MRELRTQQNQSSEMGNLLHGLQFERSLKDVKQRILHRGNVNKTVTPHHAYWELSVKNTHTKCREWDISDDFGPTCTANEEYKITDIDWIRLEVHRWNDEKKVWVESHIYDRPVNEFHEFPLSSPTAIDNVDHHLLDIAFRFLRKT